MKISYLFLGIWLLIYGIMATIVHSASSFDCLRWGALVVGAVIVGEWVIGVLDKK